MLGDEQAANTAMKMIAQRRMPAACSPMAGTRERDRRPSSMRRTFALLATALLLSACDQPARSGSPPLSVSPPSASPSASASDVGVEGVDGLVADLSATTKVPVRQADKFDASPLTGDGVLICVGHEEVRAYVYQTADLQAAAVHGIDPNDANLIGSSVVDWVGNPRFWQRDRIIVLYLGTDAPTEALLTSILGQPFARGTGGNPGGPRLNAC